MKVLEKNAKTVASSNKEELQDEIESKDLKITNVKNKDPIKNTN